MSSSRHQKVNEYDAYPEFSMLREIVPTLEVSLLFKLYKTNGFDLEKSIDAALALITSLEYEEGSCIVGETSTFGRNSINRNSTTSTTSSSIVQSIDIRRSITQVYDSQPSNPVLPNDFLRPPSYRLLVDSHNENATEFTITFMKFVDEKLGIILNLLDGEIIISSIHSSSLTRDPSLAFLSGIQIGDILSGINFEYFSSRSEISDVINLLDCPKRFIVLHLKRKYRYYNGAAIEKCDNEQFHPCIRMFLDQGVIKKENASVTSATLLRLKDRLIQWDSGWISECVDSPLNHTDTTLKPSFFSNVFSSSHIRDSISGSSRRNSNSFNNLSHSPKGDIVVSTKQLRPALFVRIIRAEENTNYIVYVLLVIDIKSGAEWFVKRRFREFHDLKEVLISLYPSIRKLEFPSKRLVESIMSQEAKLGNTGSVNNIITNQRIYSLQRFLRRIMAILPLDSLSSSTTKIQQVIQDFLSVSDYSNAISILEKRPSVLLKNTIQVYIHNIMQLDVMDKVINGFIDMYHESLPMSKIWDEEAGTKVLNNLREYIDNLTNVLYEGLSQDCIDIIEKSRKSGNELEIISLWPTIRNMLQVNNNIVSNSSTKSSSHLIDSDISNHNAIQLLGLGAGNGEMIRDPSLVVHEENLVFPANLLANIPHILSLISNSNEILSSEETSEIFNRLTDDEIRSIIKSAIRRQVEIEIYIPVASKLNHVLGVSFYKSQEILNEKVKLLNSCDQSHFGIPDNQVSPSNWNEVIEKLVKIRMKTLPQDRLELLVELCKDIPLLHQREYPNSTASIGADEFLPMFIFILVRAKIPCLLALNEELQALCDPEKRISEIGYYLATFAAAIQHIQEYDESAGLDFFIQKLGASNPQVSFDYNSHE